MRSVGRTLTAVLLVAASVGLGASETAAAPVLVQPTFAAASYQIGIGGLAVATGDVDGDGDLDIVATSQHPATVSVLLGNGDGTFASHVDYATGDEPLSVALGDLNGDGAADVVAAIQNSGISVLVANGDGTLAPHVDYATGFGTQQVTTGDVNGDTHVDVGVATLGAGAGVSLLLGNGDGTLGAATALHSVDHGGSSSAAFADVDGDRALDLIATDNTPGRVEVLLGDGAGAFTPHASLPTGDPSSGLRSVVAVDLDGDHDLDLVAVNYLEATVSVALGHGDGSFDAIVQYHSGGTSPFSVAAGDLNGDTIPDLVIANPFASTRFLLGKGDGTFAQSLAFSSSPFSVVMGDLNGDGFLDVILANRDSPQVYPDFVRVMVNTTNLATVRWSIETGPTCPSLHGDSINGGSGIFTFVISDGHGGEPFVTGATIQPDDHYVLDLSPSEVTWRTVEIYDFNTGGLIARWQDVQVFCTGATTPFAPRQGVATPGNGSATVSWLAPLSNGGAPIQYYEVTAYVGDVRHASRRVFGSSNLTATFSSLTNGVEYRFELQAYNDIGYSPISKVKRPITVGTPTAPTIGTATASNGSATVSWTPSTSDNGSPIIVYVVTAYDGYNPMVSVFAGPSATSRTVPGLTNGTTYRFRVRPYNAFGLGVFSTASNAVIPAP